MLILPVPIAGDQTQENSVVPLSRYAQLTAHTECQFFGVYDDVAIPYECRKYWTKAQRDWVNFYLNLAQQKLEDYLGYKLSPTWVREDQFDIKSTHRYMTRWGSISKIGTQASSVISSGSAISYITVPATIGPIATTVTDPNEVQIYRPGTDDLLVPSSVTIAGGNVTIRIPKCRLVKLSKMTNDNINGISPTDASNFETTVDIKRVYTDTTQHATYVGLEECDSPPCTEITTTGCGTILNSKIGSVRIVVASYNGGWVNASNCNYSKYYKVLLNYLAKPPDNRDFTMQIMQLAHALMPYAPCGCDWIRSYWNDSRAIPETTDDRVSNDFGVSNGAWETYKWAKYHRLVRAGLI